MLLTGVVGGAGVEQAGDAGLDRRERRAQVVRDAGEQRRAELVRLGIQLRLAHPGREPVPLEGDRRLAGERIQERPFVAAHGRRAQTSDGGELSERGTAQLQGHDLGRSVRPARSRDGGGADLAIAGDGDEVAAEQMEGVEEGAHEVVEHPGEGLAGQEPRRQVREEAGLALAPFGAPAFVQRARQHESHQHGGDQQAQRRRHVIAVFDPQRVARLGEEEGERQRGQDRCEQPPTQAAQQ